MGTGIFAVDGIDVAGLVAEHLGPRVLPCVLYKPGAPTARDPARPSKGPQPGAPTPHKCRGFIEDFSTASVDGTLIKAGDRKVTLLGATIEGGVEPEGGVNKDQVLVEGKVWSVHRVVSRDPAAATYILQVRDPAKGNVSA
jgi:hypothetical protein